MNDIISVDSIENLKMYNPIFLLNEDLQLDNRFCILNTDMGNIAFSYYDLGISPTVFLENKILFISYGQSYVVINLDEKKLLYKSGHTVIYEILKCNADSCIVFVGELSLLCFSLKGQLIWKNSYRKTIIDWVIVDEGIIVIFEDGEKKLIVYENGNAKSLI